MSLRINYNGSSIGAVRSANAAMRAGSLAMERLSSGLRINRASDDAASLSISEGIRAQARGKQQAYANVQSFINLVQVADGSLNQVTGLLQRMRELAVQAANDTNGLADRNALQNEISQAIAEIDRLVKDTTFNGKSLLDGTFTGQTAQVGANANETLAIALGDMRANALGLSGVTTATVLSDMGVTSGTMTINWNYGGVPGAPFTVIVNAADTLGDFLSDVGSVGFSATATLSGGVITITGGSAGPLGFSVGGTSNVATVTNLAGGTLVVGSVMPPVQSTLTASAPIGGGGVSVASNADAGDAITTIDNALGMVSTQRSALGAYQNRMEATLSNLAVSRENMMAAESRLRDADFAVQMAALTRQQILVQSSLAMTAQASQSSAVMIQLLT